MLKGINYSIEKSKDPCHCMEIVQLKDHTARPWPYSFIYRPHPDFNGIPDPGSGHMGLLHPHAVRYEQKL